jgi:hypothetical protein
MPFSTTVGGTGWSLFNSTSSNPVITLNSTDVLDPAGGNTASKIVFPAVSGTQSSGLFDTAGYLGNPQTVSIYARTLSGTASVDFNNNRSGHAEANITTITSTWTRFSLPIASPSNTTWFFQPQVDANSQGTLASQTIYVWLPQAEVTPFATSPIPTTTVAATRDADVVTVANPLASLSQPVAAWRFGCIGTPSSPSWATMPSNPNVILALGTNGTANSARLVKGQSLANALTFDTNDNAGANKAIWPSSTFNAADKTVMAGLDTSAGAMTMVPASANSGGTGTGIVSTHPATLTMGQAGGTSSIGFWGWLTNIYVDNT